MKLTLIERAREFALEAHGDQKYGKDPYGVHLAAVVSRLIQSGFDDEEMVAAGWLHDTPEDTDRTIEVIRREFGDGVGGLVWAVTSAPGPNRRERNKLTYPKILAAGPRAIALKLADRDANVESCWTTRDSKLFMYHREHRDFREALKHGDDPRLLALWERLDQLLGWYEPGRRA